MEISFSNAKGRGSCRSEDVVSIPKEWTISKLERYVTGRAGKGRRRLQGENEMAGGRGRRETGRRSRMSICGAGGRHRELLPPQL